MKKLELLPVIRAFRDKKLNIFTPLEFERLFNVSSCAAKWFIKTRVKKGDFLKIRQGLYMLADFPADKFLIANRLYEPSYISFDTALSFHGIIPETIYSITCATPKTSRDLEVGGISYNYHKIKKASYAGYSPLNYSGQTVLMADPEKAIADYLYFVALKHRGLHYERMDLSKISETKLMNYVKLFNNTKAIKLIDEIYVEFRNPKRIY